MKTKLANEKVVNDLERLIKKSKGKISPADASATTGYPLEQVKDALSRLIELYEARVTMDNETGQIQFIFKYPFFRRGKKTIKEILQNVLEVLWKGFQIVYKASIGIILIFYTVIFILILIAIIFAGRSSDRDSKIDIGSILGGLFRGILDAYTFSLITRDISYRYDDYDYRYKTYQPEKNRGKGFVKSVFSFVFGPERPKYDPLEDAKESIAFIRQNNGRITAGHIVALTGLSFEEAEARLAEYAVKFNGELEITEEGYVVAEFTDLMNKASDEFKGGKIVFYEDEVEPPYELTGNSSGRNFAIAGMNLFNLFMSFILINSFNETIYAHENMSTSELIMYNLQEFGWIVIVLGYFPFIFSILFFAIPSFRYFYVKKKEKERQINILRKKLLGTFVRHSGRKIRYDELIYLAKIDKKNEALAKTLLEKLVVELKGEINIDSDGMPIYSFDRLSKELNK